MNVNDTFTASGTSPPEVIRKSHVSSPASVETQTITLYHHTRSAYIENIKSIRLVGTTTGDLFCHEDGDEDNAVWLTRDPDCEGTSSGYDTVVEVELNLDDEDLLTWERAPELRITLPWLAALETSAHKLGSDPVRDWFAYRDWVSPACIKSIKTK